MFSKELEKKLKDRGFLNSPLECTVVKVGQICAYGWYKQHILRCSALTPNDWKLKF